MPERVTPRSQRKFSTAGGVTQCVRYSDPGQRVLYAFFTRSLRVFYLAQNRGLRRKQVVRCGPPQPPGCGAGLEVWQFSVACVPRATRHGPFSRQMVTACASMGVVLRLGRPLPPGFYHVFYRVLYAFFYSDHRQRVLYAFLRVFLRVFSFLELRCRLCCHCMLAVDFAVIACWPSTPTS